MLGVKLTGVDGLVMGREQVWLTGGRVKLEWSALSGKGHTGPLGLIAVWGQKRVGFLGVLSATPSVSVACLYVFVTRRALRDAGLKAARPLHGPKYESLTLHSLAMQMSRPAGGTYLGYFVDSN